MLLLKNVTLKNVVVDTDILFFYSLLFSSGRVDDEKDSEVRYEIETETKEEMNSVQVSVTGTAYQENNAFSTQFKSAMKTEGVDSDVVESMLGVEPDADAQAVEQEIDGDDIMPAGASTNDASSVTSEDSNGDNGWLYGVIASVVVVALIVGVVVFVTRSRSKYNGHHELEKGKSTIEMKSNPMERPDIAVAMGTMNRSSIIDKKEAKLKKKRSVMKMKQGPWEMFLDPDTSLPFWFHSDSGVSQWEKPKEWVE